MRPIEARIAEAIADARREGLTPKSIYLTPADREELGATWPVDQVDGLPIKRVSGKGRSTVYCKHGIARQLKAPPRLRRATPLKSKPKPPTRKRP